MFGSGAQTDFRQSLEGPLAPFPGAHEVLDESSRARLEALDKAAPLAFLCHHGNSSREAAERFRALGFRDVHNVEGGIDAWSQRIDVAVPRY